LKLICQLEKIIQEEVPWAYGIYQDDYRLAQSRVLNYHADEMVFTKWKFVNIKN
jgi:hypothetical protein